MSEVRDVVFYLTDGISIPCKCTSAQLKPVIEILYKKDIDFFSVKNFDGSGYYINKNNITKIYVEEDTE